MDQARLPLSFELGTQVADVDFQDIGGPLEIQPPDPIQDDLAGENLAWPPQKEGQQFILGRGKFNLTCATMRYTGASIQFNISIAQDLMAFLLAAPQQGFDPCYQFLGGKRLDQIIIGSCLKSFHAVCDGITRRKHQNGHIVASCQDSSENLTSQAQLETLEEARRTRRRPALVVLLLVAIRARSVIRYEVLSCLLWDERYGVAELFKAVDVVTLNLCPILLIKVISSQVGVRFFGP